MRSDKQARLAAHVTRLDNSAQVVKTLNQNRKIEENVIFCRRRSLTCKLAHDSPAAAAAPACVCLCVNPERLIYVPLTNLFKTR
jgi:hypothetical protein